MIGLVIATHSNLADELLNACEMILGPRQENTRAVNIGKDDDVEEVRALMETAIRETGQAGDGVLILTDMFGGTPSNISLSFLAPGRVEVVTGVNLPMALKFFNGCAEHDLSELAKRLQAYGQQSISVASEFLTK